MRLIDAQPIVKFIMDGLNNPDKMKALGHDAIEILAEIEYAPTVDAVEVVHGRWEKHGKHDWRCSACRIGVPYSFTGHTYCHNCGAKMDGDGNGLLR
jgi:hypothetical protein